MKILFGQFLAKIKALACLLVLGLTITGISPQREDVRAQLLPDKSDLKSPEKIDRDATEKSDLKSTEKVDLEAINRIKEEESKHSQVMEMVGYLTDVTGPRLTGSLI